MKRIEISPPAAFGVPHPVDARNLARRELKDRQVARLRLKELNLKGEPSLQDV
nr:hypothetical protein [Candidatus Njordarchaeota archaeon]